MSESVSEAAARQSGYTSVQQNADEGWARIEALRPLAEVIDGAFLRGSHAVLIAVRDSEWVKTQRAEAQAEHEAARRAEAVR